MDNKKKLSTDLRIEEFARELGLQLRLILLEKKSKKQATPDEIVKPITTSQPSKKLR